jgi:hypothetical protein
MPLKEKNQSSVRYLYKCIYIITIENNTK